MNKQKGFSLIELLLYISMTAIVVLVISGLLYTILQSKVKNQTIAEVEQQGALAVQIISQTIRNSQSINTPTSGSSGNSLSLAQVSASVNPTVFDLSNGSLRITEGTGSAVSLTNSRVSVSGLTFQNLSASVKFQFTISHINSGSRNEYDYTKDFYGTANVRPN